MISISRPPAAAAAAALYRRFANRESVGCVRRFTAASSSSSSSRRRRPTPVSSKFQQALEDQELCATSGRPDRGGLREAFAPGNFDDYLKKASLSPWVPVPDPVARKMLEIAKAGPEDIHVELGSGDGRMNFHALDPPFSVQRSLGVDVDEKLVAVAEERLGKRHPRPQNLDFAVQDLLEEGALEAILRDATLVTMYFVGDALRLLKPRLEEAMGDREVRVVCCGYEMPGWEPRWVEVILDLPIYYYTYNAPIEKMPSLTPGEHAEMVAAMKLEAETEPLMSLEEEVFFTRSSQDDDVEKIEVPLFDPSTMIDGHWDDFDDEEIVDDLDGNPAISAWRKPE